MSFELSCDTTAYIRLYHLIPLWLSAVNRPARFRTREKGGDESDPPKRRGGMRTLLIEVLSVHVPLLRSHAGRSRPHLSLREGLRNSPQGAALKARMTDL